MGVAGEHHRARPMRVAGQRREQPALPRAGLTVEHEDPLGPGTPPRPHR
jgi:hypothetical protein